MSFYIGNVKLEHGLMLAPMAGVTDASFRAVCRALGAEYTVSEMVCAKAMCYEQRKKGGDDESKSGAIATIREEELPMAIQIFGSEPEYMAEAAEMIEKCSYRGCKSTVAPSAIDINMGCPVKKITSIQNAFPLKISLISVLKSYLYSFSFIAEVYASKSSSFTWNRESAILEQ